MPLTEVIAARLLPTGTAFPSAIRSLADDYAKSRWEMLRQTMQSARRDVAGKTLFQATHQPYLNHTVLAFEYLADGRTPPRVEYAEVSADPAVQRERIAKSDFVLAPTPDAGDVLARQPTASSSFRAEMIRLRKRPEAPTCCPHSRSCPGRGGSDLQAPAGHSIDRQRVCLFCKWRVGIPHDDERFSK